MTNKTESVILPNRLTAILVVICIFTIFHAQPLVNVAYKIQVSLLAITYLWAAIFACMLFVKAIKVNIYDIFFIAFSANLIGITLLKYQNSSDLSHIENVMYAMFIYFPIRGIVGIEGISVKEKMHLTFVILISITIILFKSVLSAQDWEIQFNLLF